MKEKIHHLQKAFYICKKRCSTDDDSRKYRLVRDHFNIKEKYRGTAHNACNLRYKIPKEIPAVFHNGSTHNYDFIIKELAEELRVNLNVSFSVPIKKELDHGKKSTYKIKCLDSVRFMSSLLSSFVDNLSEGIHNYKCTNCKSCLAYVSREDNQLIFKCIKCSNECIQMLIIDMQRDCLNILIIKL